MHILSSSSGHILSSSSKQIIIICVAMNKPLCLPVKTRFLGTTTNNTMPELQHNIKVVNLDEWVTLPISYSSLPLSTHLAITIWVSDGPRKHVPLAGTTFKLFAKHKTAREAQYRLYLYPNQQADGACGKNCKTMSKGGMQSRATMPSCEAS